MSTDRIVANKSFISFRKLTSVCVRYMPRYWLVCNVFLLFEKSTRNKSLIRVPKYKQNLIFLWQIALSRPIYTFDRFCDQYTCLKQFVYHYILEPKEKPICSRSTSKMCAFGTRKPQPPDFSLDQLHNEAITKRILEVQPPQAVRK